jgi:hypothetical protein
LRECIEFFPDVFDPANPSKGGSLELIQGQKWGGDHEDDRGVNDSTQRRQVPLCSGERSGQPGEKRHVPDRIDRRPKSRKIFADFN